MGSFVLFVASIVLACNGSRLQGRAVARNDVAAGGYALLCFFFGGAGVAISLMLIRSG